MFEFWSDSSSFLQALCVRTVKALVRLRECAGSPEPSLVAYVVSTIISCWLCGVLLLFLLVPKEGLDLWLLHFLEIYFHCFNTLT